MTAEDTANYLLFCAIFEFSVGKIKKEIGKRKEKTVPLPFHVLIPGSTLGPDSTFKIR